MKKFLSKIMICIFGLVYFANTSVFAHEMIMNNMKKSSHHHEDMGISENMDMNDLNHIDDTKDLGCESKECEKHCYKIENSKITAISNQLSSSVKNIQNIVKSKYTYNIYGNIYQKENYLAKYIYNNGPPDNNQKFIKYADLVGVIVLIC